MSFKAIDSITQCTKIVNLGPFLFIWLQATLADSFLADLDELSDNEAEIPVSIVFYFFFLTLFF